MMTLLAQQSGDSYLRFNRLHSLSEGWQWALFGLFVMAMIGFIVALYRRDGVELTRGARWSLVLLRIFALAAVVFYFLDLEKGSERMLVNESRALLLVDTSLSMGLAGAEETSPPTRRIDEVIAQLSQGPLIDELRQRHDVVVYRFDQELQPQEIASYPKNAPKEDRESEADLSKRRMEEFQTTQFWFFAGAAIAVAAGVVLLVSLVMASWPRMLEPAGWVRFGSTALLVVAVTTMAVAHLSHPEFTWRSLLGLDAPALVAVPDQPKEKKPEEGDDEQPEEIVIDWKEQLKPRGVETRLGGALRFLINKERGGPIAGVTVITDGRQNAGLDVTAAVISAQDAAIPVYTIGLGSDKRPINIKLVDIEAPSRAFPSDPFGVTGFVQGYGMEGRTVRVELFAKLGEKDPELVNADMLIDEKQVKLGDDGELSPIRFETSQDAEGKWNYVLKVSGPKEDKDARDNQRAAIVEVLDRKTKVLLIAGGPTREYRFLRNMLYRDSEVTSHVWLQSGKPGIAKESDLTLFEFPSIADDLFQYDAIVAFDPDWMALDAEQVELLERWVAEKAGGLIVVAGPVQTPEWANFSRGNDPRIDTIKALYPVIFYSWRSSALNLGRFGGVSAWPIQFTQDGEDAEFLWLEDDALASQGAWEDFEGVYGYYAVKDPKLGARVYAHFSDIDTSIDGELPIYMAGHFYGAGRVFFQASGEMWRIRANDINYFHQYYTKLIRWVAQGRLMRDSSHGVLMVDKDRCLMGDHITVHAILNDAQYQPLKVPEVEAIVTQPDGTRSNLTLRKVQDGARDGMYVSQFTTAFEGDYRIELKPPEAAIDELLSRVVRSRLPALETEQPQRNDLLLRELADKTEGQYFVGMEAAVFRGETGASLSSVLEPQDQVTYLPGAPNRRFATQMRAWLIGLICGALCLEWLCRRLGKLA